MKRILFIILSLIFASCEEQRHVITEIGNITMSDDRNRITDTIQSAFAINIDFETLMLGQNWNIIPTAQAFKKDVTYLNAIDLSSIKVSIDKDLIHNGQTIMAGEKIPDYSLELYTPRLTIVFPEASLQAIKFQKGPTKFLVTGKNTDNIQFKFEKEVYMNL